MRIEISYFGVFLLAVVLLKENINLADFLMNLLIIERLSGFYWKEI